MAKELGVCETVNIDTTKCAIITIRIESMGWCLVVGIALHVRFAQIKKNKNVYIISTEWVDN